ncbi:ankyrin repeat-containing domain protein [Butyriboletus roseoflavus]|nr:ankyrin repeat-containing domain protein [Butyriboletus roseoflavus]
MKKILDRPGFIGIDTGSERLRNMFQRQFAEFDPNKISPFALACMCGKYEVVKEVVESGTAPDLSTTQTPFQFGFVTFTVLGAQRLRPRSPDNMPMRHIDILSYLIDAGAPPDIPDISGHTALHHACTPPVGHAETTKLLLEKGANVNAQNRYGEVPIFFPFQGGDVTLVDLLMEHGADLDIPDGNGDSPRKMCLVFGAEVTAAVQRWERKRKGEVAPLEEKRCENCKGKGNGLRHTARLSASVGDLHVVRRVSFTQTSFGGWPAGAHWKVHKPACNPFCAQTTVTLKPSYSGGGFETVSRADVTRQVFGLATPTTRPLRPRPSKNAEAESKSMVIKVQVPFSLVTSSPVNSAHGSIFIYDERRDFVCTVSRASNPDAYDAVTQVVRSRGVGGAKAYFAAELKNPDELVVKISEVLAEQPF